MQPALIPLNDLRRHSVAVMAELLETMDAVLAGGQYILGPWVEKFETAFASYCGAKHAVGMANGTDALELALIAAGCKAGDEVVTVANAGGYATTAILNAGLLPVYADIDADSFLMTPETFQNAITPATKAAIVTHLYGLMADMPALCAIAKAHGIIVIEDCAHAHGAAINGKKAGSYGALGCFSFYPTKNLGALGDAGCVITSDDRLAECLHALRQYGWGPEKYRIPEHIGRNSRMDALQAALLLRLLPHLDGWNEKRRHIINRYRSALGSKNMRFQQVGPDESFVAHLCVIRASGRAPWMETLRKDNIATDVHYPVADYAQPAVIKRIGAIPPLPQTEQVMAEIISLPCFPEMLEEEIDRVIMSLQRHATL